MYKIKITTAVENTNDTTDEVLKTIVFKAQVLLLQQNPAILIVVISNSPISQPQIIFPWIYLNFSHSVLAMSNH